MNRLCLVLVFALLALPATAAADDVPTSAMPPARPGMSATQRQAMFKTFSTYRAKELQLRKQFRSQVLSALSPAHRSAVAAAIGKLAISESPNPRTAAQQIDAALSSSERQNVLSSAKSFADQSRALREQMRAELKSELPSPPPGMPQRPMRTMHAGMHRGAGDAGMVLLMALGRPFEMRPHGGRGGMPAGGPPPDAPPPGGSPPA